MSPLVPHAPATTPWRRDREPRWGRATACTAAALLALFLFSPTWEFDRFDGLATDDGIDPLPEGSIRLIPAPRAGAAEQPRVEAAAAPDVALADDTPAADEPDFAWDPSTPYDAAAELLAPAAPEQPAPAGRPARRPGDARNPWIPRLHRHHAGRRRAPPVDWMDAHMADLQPLYEAQGRAERIAEIYRRAVTEAEEEDP